MFKFSENLNYSMPAHFGGTEGQPRRWTYSDVTTIGINYETDLEKLAQYIPEDFEITQPTVALLYAMNRGVEWMAGGNYNLIAVNVLVAYKRGRERIEGESVALCSPSLLCRQGDGATLDRKFVRDGVPQENGRLFGEVVLITENA